MPLAVIVGMMMMMVMMHRAAISCTHPEILDHVRVGHRVFVDDGKIEAIVRSSNETYLELEIISPKGRTGKIKSNKGINFPDFSN